MYRTGSQGVSPSNYFLTFTNRVGNHWSKVKSGKAAEEGLGEMESLEFVGQVNKMFKKLSSGFHGDKITMLHFVWCRLKPDIPLR